MFRCLDSFVLAFVMAMAIPIALSAASPAARPLLVNLSGHEVHPFAKETTRFSIFFFVRTDCPIANRYAPEMRRLDAAFGRRGIAFWLVYPTAEETARDIASHQAAFQLPGVALRDPHHLFTRKARARVTPEAALFDQNGALLYHGRIDNRYVDFDQIRPIATQHDLADALTSALAGKPHKVKAAPGIGCLIESSQ